MEHLITDLLDIPNMGDGLNHCSADSNFSYIYEVIFNAKFYINV